MVYVNFRNLRELKALLKKLNLKTDKTPKYWGGVFGGFRTVKGDYNGCRLSLGTEGDEEDVFVEFAFEKKFTKNFYITSDSRFYERILKQPLFKKFQKLNLNIAQKNYQTLRYFNTELVNNKNFQKNAVELINALAPHNGHFYIDNKKIKLIFPPNTKFDQLVLKAGLAVHTAIRP